MIALSRRMLAPALLAALCCLTTPTYATTVRPMNVLDLIDNAATIIAGRVESVTEGFAANGMPYTEVTLRVLDRFRGAPEAMDLHLAHGDSLGLCPGDAPL